MRAFIVMLMLAFTSYAQAMCPQILGDYRSQIYDAQVIQFADQNSISLLNIKYGEALELRAELQKLVKQVSPNTKPLVGILDSEQVLVKTQTHEGVQFIFISMGLLKFVKDDRELQQILNYELTHPEAAQQSIAAKYQPFLSGTVEVQPFLERAYDPKEVTGSANIVKLAKKVTFTSEYMYARDEKFDRLMAVDLSNTRQVIQPLFTGGPLPSPDAAYFLHSQFEGYYEIFKAYYPLDKTPAETLRYFEVRLQMLVRAQMIQLVEEVLDARTKSQLPLNREEILILHHMLEKIWMLKTDSTPMMRMGHISWLMSWTYQGATIDKEIEQLTVQRKEIKNTNLRDVVDSQIQDLANRKKILQIKVANILVLYDLDQDTFVKLKQISTYPDKVPPHMPQWESIFNERIRGLGALFTRANELRERIDSEFAYGGMLRDLRAKPGDAFWLLRAADKMSVPEMVEINKKAFDILLEMKANEPLRTLIRSDHDAVMVKWFQLNQAEAQDYVIRVLNELAKDESFDANKDEIHRGTFVKNYISSNKYLEKYLTENDPEKRSHEDYILTPEMRLALGELSAAQPIRGFAGKPAMVQQILLDENFDEKQRNEQLVELVIYKNHLNEFYPAIYQYLELATQSPDTARMLAMQVEMAAIESYTQIFKTFGIENPKALAETFLFLTSRYFGALTNRPKPSPQQIEVAVKQLSALPFINGRYGFIKIGVFINLIKSFSKKEQLSIVDVAYPYLDNQYLEPLPDGMSADRYFNEKYQIAQYLLKKQKPNFNIINRVMLDARAGFDEKAYAEQERMFSPLQRTMMIAQFEFHWNTHQALEGRARIQQALKDYLSDNDLLIWNYGFKEGYIELAEAYTKTAADRRYFMEQVLEILLATKESNPRYMGSVIESLQMLLKLNL